MKKKLLTQMIMMVLALGISNAQESKVANQKADSIHFEQRLKWSEILSKAKAEHKYVFVDCYATWCGPCKWMEANIYINKKVAELYNKNFISLKIQMDQVATDDSLTKSHYNRAKEFEANYHVNAYPTFLFFDPDGSPVHKVTGSMDEKQFIKLASDAKNPRKQYYAILKNFEPGRLDTAEEKGLAFAFFYSDKELAGKIAADYLSRIPRSRLKMRFSGGLIQRFQDDPRVLTIATHYVGSLNDYEFAQKGNVDIVTALIKKPQIKAIALRHILSFSGKAFIMPGNLQVMLSLDENSIVQKIAQKYISTLSRRRKFDEETISFIADFTNTTDDAGFKIIYHHGQKMDSILKNKDFSHAKLQRCIYNTEFAPKLIIAKNTGKSPDFDAIKSSIEKKYTSEYATGVIADAKVNWYGYLVNVKKSDQYWPNLIHAEIDRFSTLLNDSTSFKSQTYDLNNFCYSDVFPHEDDAEIIDTAIRWMKEVNELTNNRSADDLDTYACLLYKAGHLNAALYVERQALELYSQHIAQGAQGRVDYTNKKIVAMQHGEKIWLQKEFL